MECLLRAREHHVHKYYLKVILFSQTSIIFIVSIPKVLLNFSQWFFFGGTLPWLNFPLQNPEGTVQPVNCAFWILEGTALIFIF
jgi:hypothetical protein